jgi:hypothetical protein
MDTRLAEAARKFTAEYAEELSIDEVRFITSWADCVGVDWSPIYADIEAAMYAAIRSRRFARANSGGAQDLLEWENGMRQTLLSASGHLMQALSIMSKGELLHQTEQNEAWVAHTKRLIWTFSYKSKFIHLGSNYISRKKDRREVVAFILDFYEWLHHQESVADDSQRRCQVLTATIANLAFPELSKKTPADIYEVRRVLRKVTSDPKTAWLYGPENAQTFKSKNG